MNKQRASRLAVHVALILYTLLALGPVLLILINSFKSRRAIFNSPLSLPIGKSFSLVGYNSVLAKSDFGLYFVNSLTVTVASLALVLFFGAMSAWALTEYRFRGNAFVGLFMAIGTMMALPGVGSRRTRSSSPVLRPMWQQIGNPVSWMHARSGS